MMDFSLGEFEALAKRAARGAGLSWGMAEETGKAARWLAAFGLPATETLAAYLTRYRTESGIVVQSEVWAAQSSSTCPLAFGAALSDHGAELLKGGPITAQAVGYPLLVLPFVAGICRRENICMSLGVADASVQVNGALMSMHGDIDALRRETPSDVTCQVIPPFAGGYEGAAKRCHLSSDDLAALTRLAHRTYAPSSEASRILGAGAGVLDED